MNKIEKLLNELCPNGVEFKALGEVCELNKFRQVGANEIELFKKSNCENQVKLLPSSQNYDWWSDRESCKSVLCNGEVITLGRARYANLKYHNGYFVSSNNNIIQAKNGLMGRFLYHFISGNVQKFYAETSTYPKFDMDIFKKFQIPIPPLEIQEEIVKILDTFTELEAELEARRRQYEYYRNKLLSFEYLKTNGGGYELKTLGEICEISTGGSNSVDEETNGIYPFYTRSQEIKRINRYEFDETAIITSGDGVGVGKIIHFIQGKYALHQRAYRIHILQDSINPKFVYFYMKAYFYDYIMKTAVNSSVSSLRMKMLTGFQIPIPPLATQEKIVNILDKFHALTTDLTSGIPAEIEARKKQYEYYRNKLLTFKEAR